ncbi:MAG: hypothetical protein GF350_08020 [Chitinivibrionales bacterium]|nr:hypothetical protein [Chitinivibrionales bacterium]
MRCASGVLLCVWVLFADFSDTRLAMTSSAARLGAGCPAFSAVESYNSYDFAGSPLGLLEKEDAMVKLGLGTRLVKFGLRDDPDSISYKASSFYVPDLLIGKPGIVYAKLFYMPGPIAVVDAGREFSLESLRQDINVPVLRNYVDSVTGGPVSEIEFPLHRFGLTLAGGTENGIFRIGVTAEGFYGKEEMSGSSNTRVVMGFRNVGLHLGSQLHELVRIGFKGEASGYLDTLDDVESGYVNPHEDRYFYGQIPRFGGNIDFGSEGFPVLSNFEIEFGKNRFIYVTKVGGDGLWDVIDSAHIYGREDGNEDAVVSDSMSWNWQTMGTIATDVMMYHPAVRFGYWRNSIVQWQPTEANDNLFKYERERKDTSWEYSSFTFGIGGAASFKEYAKLSFEYTYSNLKLTYGDAWPDTSDRNESYPRIHIGLQGNIHALPFMNMPESIELFLCTGFLYLRENSRFNTWRSEEFSLVNRRISPMSQYYRYLYYDPAFGWVDENTVARFSVGLGGTFLDKLFAGNLFFAFPAKKIEDEKYRGFEFGVDLEYSVRANQPETNNKEK